ncbi:unnamed protein product [Candidula unifasciata]|uniref:PX domain-containing protein n=1 Tax=Candidula unifasciata TaxID=100452 RepID=A0A8S3Z782_9EUPU|nr:unnamed protein product [Candidula unifasciata]
MMLIRRLDLNFKGRREKQSKRTTQTIDYSLGQVTLPKIVVKSPVVHDTWTDGKFITYMICIRTDHPSFHLHLSAIRRRFSEIRWLLKVLRANHPHIQFPAPPAKKIFGEQFESTFVNFRLKEIEEFLNKLVATDTVLSDTAFHLFLQTDLTTQEIEQYFDGTLPEATIDRAWQNASHLHSSIMPLEPQEIVMGKEDLHYSSQMSLSSEDLSSQSSFRNDNCGPALLDVINCNYVR